MLDLLSIYLRTLERCAPERLVARSALECGGVSHRFADIVAIGKCAGALLDGIADVRDAFVAIPEGYREPTSKAIVARGGHPHLTAASFEAGRRLLEFVDAHDEILFLVSGGGSACVEVPLAPFTERDLIETNARLIAAGIPIGAINTVRKHLSAIKGGRLAARVRGGTTTLVYSDVGSGALADVASGPTLPDTTTKSDAIRVVEPISARIAEMLRSPNVPETVQHLGNYRVSLIADNATLTAAAAAIARESGARVDVWEGQIEGDVEEVAVMMAERAAKLAPGVVLIAGGEPTVRVMGGGKGGRCSELAVRFARLATKEASALFASSDGVDGNSGAAGILIRQIPDDLDTAAIDEALARSDSMAVALQVGEPIMIPPTGNNLRDLFLMAHK